MPTSMHLADDDVFEFVDLDRLKTSVKSVPDALLLSSFCSNLKHEHFKPSDNLSSVASTFGVETQSIVDVNGNNIQPYDTIFVPVNQLPQLAQPTVAVPVPSGAPPPEKTERKGVIIGLAVGLGIAGLLLVLVSGVWFYREGLLKKRRDVEKVEEKRRMQLNGGRKGLKDIEVNLMADVSDCLDKYRVFKIDELKEATNGFGENCLIEGSVFKGSINGETYAIKKMKWNACEELKILQKLIKFNTYNPIKDDLAFYISQAFNAYPFIMRLGCYVRSAHFFEGVLLRNVDSSSDEGSSQMPSFLQNKINEAVDFPVKRSHDAIIRTWTFKP
ncbi:hypothetical protein D5086_016845 [Populus alba]|uniref:Uncharacterized protein n=1 Tax=Populus alba TaxID=43335 RepID=A0ACC4BXW7_POPAL